VDLDLPSTPETLDQLLDLPADRRPDAEALTDGDERLTWRGYRDAADRLADTLAARGVRPGDRVGVHLPKSSRSFVAVHAILRADGVVVPIDPFAPPAYAAEVLRDAGVEVLVSGATGARLDAMLDDTSVRDVVDPTATHDDPARSRSNVSVRSNMSVRSGDPAYIMYTSGSTGTPKGIVHTHASALAYARLAVSTYSLASDDRLANIAPLHFDQSTFELYAGPLAGALVLVVPDHLTRFPASLSDIVARERITVWYSVPYAITQLAARGVLDERDMSHLRWVLFGGESFPPLELAAVMRRLPGARFSNVYGPAEVNQCTYHHVDEPPDDDDPIPIGIPWEGTSVLVVDQDDRPIDGGEPGELLVSTDTMMDRYWGRPDLTDAAIQIRAGDRRRWYRTGDVVRRRADGLLVFVGRLDHQVKVRGHRIELEAVELVIADEPTVDACAVVVDGDDRLVALVAPPLTDAAHEALTARLRARLPRYAVPAEILEVDSLPRGGTGKIDRRAAVAALDQIRSQLGDVRRGPQR
jgi:amino acid adenylation domain-containing protein